MSSAPLAFVEGPSIRKMANWLDRVSDLQLASTVAVVIRLDAELVEHG